MATQLHDFSKLTELAYLLDGNAKLEAASKQKNISAENLVQMMWKIAECYEADGNFSMAIDEAEKILKIIDILDYDSFDVYVSFLIISPS